MSRNKTMTSSASFAVSKLGQWTTARFTDLLAPLGLRPRHCAVLEILRARPRGQLALARALRINPHGGARTGSGSAGLRWPSCHVAIRRDQHRELTLPTDEHGRHACESAAAG